MTSEAVAAAPRLRDADGPFAFEPHHCFACGDLNEQGLHLQLHADPEGAWAELTIAPRFQGWDSVAHGGIVCTILDEVMAWARARTVVPVQPGFIRNEQVTMLTLPGDPTYPSMEGFDTPEETRFILANGRWRPVAAGPPDTA